MATDAEQGDREGGTEEASDARGEHEGREEMEKFEEAEEVPSDPREWPGGKAKYLTFGGSEDKSNEPYGEGVTGKLGPASVEHHSDGSVSVEGEQVEDPDRFKGDPIPGGPTDPDSPDLAGEDSKAQGEGAPANEGARAKEEEK